MKTLSIGFIVSLLTQSPIQSTMPKIPKKTSNNLNTFATKKRLANHFHKKLINEIKKLDKNKTNEGVMDYHAHPYF